MFIVTSRGSVSGFWFFFLLSISEHPLTVDELKKKKERNVVKHKRCSPFNMALNYTMGCSPPCQPAFEGIFFSCSCSMLLFSFQLVLLKETHSQTPTMPWGIRVMVEGGQGLDGGLPRDIGEGWVVVRRKGEGVEPNINTDYVYMHTTKQVTGAIQVTAGNYRSCLHALQTRT